MHESKVLTYPSGSMLIRAALKKQEIWVFESKSICNTTFKIDISD